MRVALGVTGCIAAYKAVEVLRGLQKRGASVYYNDPYFPNIGKGRKYDLQMERVPLDNISDYDCIVIVTDHSDYDYPRIVAEAQLVVDTRNATSQLKSPKVIRC